MARLKRASIIGIFGGSGSGKSHQCKQITRKDRRLVVWDSMDEYTAGASCRRIEGDLYALLKAMREKSWRIAYVPEYHDMSKQFDFFCRIVRAVGNCRCVVEEMNEVTQASAAPPAWKWLCSRGRHRGVKIIGLSQRPASVDKDFIGNATEIYAGRLTYDRDWKALTSKFGRESEKLATLPDWTLLHWKG